MSEPPQSTYYFIDDKATYDTEDPSPQLNFISTFNLDQIAKSVARTNSDGTKDVKLRKSYKSHISDLLGKHYISKEHNLSPIVFGPPPDFVKLEPFDKDYLSRTLTFEKSSMNGIAGFDPRKLAMNDQVIEEKKPKRKHKTISPAESEQEQNKRRHVQVHF
ncbi:RNA polymerase II mediator complex subunit [Komagataella phaffii CBS 7435]|uniref:Mediator of RNA polymerase II transcription subunit 19 n=1 Tax=Komagataella phaffii (strain ATCC 76273 / CBS 7435 / CECT 11047 / NRRL Y-11430 / Wegner 21-1) TaxID=981350 RepID=F2QUK6_KOMPC|nr:GQ67_04186T0 [Komagataella phaffii]CAH2449042.1 RNA polymerase II mediator complex subunit [Komagataella phaffii CBS 7435]CCA39084.1 RNA polymerase II mediator complex subunit [Komagataella phaffii CBS 7435]